MEAATPEEIFSYCLENPDNLSEEQLLEKFPLQREELRALLGLDKRLASTLPQLIPQGAHDAIEQRLLEASEARRHYEAPPPNAVRQPVKPSERVRNARRVSWARRMAWAFGGLALFVGVLWLLAARSLPDSPLYGVKLATEDLLLSTTSDSASLVRGNIGLANARLVDMRTMNVNGKLAAAGQSFENYNRHLTNGVSTWKGLPPGEHTDLDKLLYASSIAGQRTFQTFGNVFASLPPALQATITKTLADLDALTTETTQKLRAAGIDLDQVLREASGALGGLLTPVTSASPLPVPTSTPFAMATGTPDDDATRRSALDAAQAVISRGGNIATPIVAAAETVIAGVPGTPLAQAQQTVLSGRAALPTASPTSVLPLP